MLLGDGMVVAWGVGPQLVLCEGCVGKRSCRGPGPGDVELVVLVLGPPEPTAASDMRGLDRVVGALLWFLGGKGGKQGAVVGEARHGCSSRRCVHMCVC